MRKFNISRGYCTQIEGMAIPKGAFYGKDQWGYWVCIHKELYPLDIPTLELYRWNNICTDWVLTVEQSKTVDMITRRANAENLWNIPIEYAKFRGVHRVSAEMSKAILRDKYCRPIKRANAIYESRRSNMSFIQLDIAEKAMCRLSINH